MNIHPSELDHFETTLLRELRTHVADRSSRRRSVRRRAAGAAIAAAAAAAVVVTGVGGGVTASPAYAVEHAPDGDVVVTINRLEDAAGLEAALATQGVDAEVSYRPTSGAAGRPPSVVISPPPTGEPQDDATYVVDVNPDDVPSYAASEGDSYPSPHPHASIRGCGSTEPATLRQEGDSWVLRIPSGSALLDRHIRIATDAQGSLAAFYEGDDPGAFCGVITLG